MEQIGRTSCDTFLINSECGKINGWYFVRNPSYNTIIISHGNAGNMSYDYRLITDLIVTFKCNVCVYDYSGYGHSSGNISEHNCYKSGEAVTNYILNHHHVPISKIIMFGRSLGSGIASYLAQKYGCNKLIILSGFSSVRNLFYDLLPNDLRLFKFIGICINDFPTLSYIAKYMGHTLLLHSKDDEIIPYDNALCNVVNDRCTFIEIGGTHNNPTFSKSVTCEIKKFIDE